MNDLVSIIVPVYNCEEYIAETLESIRNQTFTNWKAILIDDKSSDHSKSICKQYAEMDQRFIVKTLSQNSGAAIARNAGLKIAKGRYIAFLDADDLWYPDKLEKQLVYMKANNASMCYTGYETISKDGSVRNKVCVPKTISYKQFLKNTLTCSHTIMFDLSVINKELLVMPNLRRGQDAATWLQVLKTGIVGYGLDQPLAKYRKHNNSVSSNKFKAIRRTWYLFRKVEKLTLPYACYCFCGYAINAIIKRI